MIKAISSSLKRFSIILYGSVWCILYLWVRNKQQKEGIRPSSPWALGLVNDYTTITWNRLRWPIEETNEISKYMYLYDAAATNCPLKPKSSKDSRWKVVVSRNITRSSMFWLIYLSQRQDASRALNTPSHNSPNLAGDLILNPSLCYPLRDSTKVMHFTGETTLIRSNSIFSFNWHIQSYFLLLTTTIIEINLLKQTL